MQVELEAHQPQPPVAAQSLHVVWARHTSQSAAYQRQSAHEPDAGPVDVPVTQTEVGAHQPQPLVAPQVSQVVLERHGSQSDGR